ncbi:hypothetical protein CLAFUW4_13317 [Fulvia fulva]|uniref:Uncharacterized protein n=1 Tax=Passalora fulva TaxID=5499 RepID=A0A9Q8PKJ2_PASFU|nr:uncharacterized protein CLAFUR5_13171 [Fulvia fulva]KAK4612022.1 hypothetical protein CLAFUR4_13322 [Fulvia fulva]KAK4612656.1 hypothetical protein CLAFUR0_13327 [Fulvia fulva]UJO24107.1 hypothetical protein CLAFUR5_13171 [Fulvia fulva]WPV20889.1 hypothetical protein CLAFUW4_13317 [Fulvia fulva]WPV36417.1 hypothetical protein CLAFUW7_13324 [Fulvia fulva]
MPTPRTAFISGPLDVSHAYFTAHYTPLISSAIERGDSFVLGPVSGIDTLALEYLLSHNLSTGRIKIYMASWEIASRPSFVKEIRENLGKEGVVVAKTKEGGDVTTTQGRDAAMTRGSEYDILRFRTEGECKRGYGVRWRARVSNTERNWRRRRRRRDGNDNDDEGDVVYVRHLSSEEVNERRGREGDGVPECDGMCWGHRDVVEERDVLGVEEVWGFGNDGVRMS